MYIYTYIGIYRYIYRYIQAGRGAAYICIDHMSSALYISVPPGPPVYTHINTDAKCLMPYTVRLMPFALCVPSAAATSLAIATGSTATGSTVTGPPASAPPSCLIYRCIYRCLLAIYRFYCHRFFQPLPPLTRPVA